MQRRHFQGDYATAFLTLVFQMECQVRALQMNDRGIAEKQTIAGKCFNFALDSRRKLAIWPKRTSMSKSFIANYRDERLFMCKWAIKGECNLSSRCATTVESRDGDVNITRKRKKKEKINADRLALLFANLSLRSWNITWKSLFRQMTTQKKKSSRAQHLLSIKAIRGYLAYKRMDNKAEAGSIGRCGLAEYSDYLWSKSDTRVEGDITAVRRRYSATHDPTSTIHSATYTYVYTLERIRRKRILPRSWILCHSLRWPYITAPLPQRARCLILRRELVHSER